MWGRGAGKILFAGPRDVPAVVVMLRPSQGRWLRMLKFHIIHGLWKGTVIDRRLLL
jgi:hypothetical protein